MKSTPSSNVVAKMQIGRKFKNSESDSYKPKSDKQYADAKGTDTDKSRY